MKVRGIALAVGCSLASSVEGQSHPFSGKSMRKEDFDYLRGLAEHIISPRAMEAYKNADQMGQVDLSVFDPEARQNGHRRLGATDEECGVFLAASIAPRMWECFDMAQTLLGLVTEKNCKTTYDFSQANMQRICTNHCYAALTSTLVTMSQAGCSASVLKQSCDECSSGEVCVGTKCRQVCSSSLPCNCDYTCSNGACIPPSGSEVQLNDMGVNGYRLALDYLCAVSPSDKQYCFSKIFNVFNSVDASTFCTQLSPIGCCTGTVFSFVSDCASANDTIATSVGTISLSDLSDFCPNIDFKTVCPGIEPINKGVCLEGYSLSAAWPSAKASMIFVFLGAMVAASAVLWF